MTLPAHPAAVLLQSKVADGMGLKNIELNLKAEERLSSDDVTTQREHTDMSGICRKRGTESFLYTQGPDFQ